MAKKDSVITIRVTKAEKCYIEDIADYNGITVSDLLLSKYREEVKLMERLMEAVGDE